MHYDNLMTGNEPRVIDLDKSTGPNKENRSALRRFRQTRIKVTAACLMTVLGVVAGATGAAAWPTAGKSPSAISPPKTMYGFITQPLTFKALNGSTAIFTGRVTLANVGAQSIEVQDIDAGNAVIALDGAQSAVWISPDTAENFVVNFTADCGVKVYDTRLQANLEAFLAEGDVLSVPRSVSLDLTSWQDDISQACFLDSSD